MSRSFLHTRLAAAAVGLALLATACGGASGGQETAASTDEAPATEASAVTSAAVPQLTGEFETILGEQLDLASLQGQDVVFWFWTPW